MTTARAQKEVSAETPAPDGAPVQDASEDDDGYFGPDSVSWRIFVHPATQVMIAQITNALESPHIVFQYVLAEHDPVFGARQRSANAAPERPVTFYDRIVRTVSVPAPILFGTRRQADLAARKLFNYHRPMQGTMRDDGSRYSATTPEAMLFAAVTIAHAALLAYENFAFVGGRRVGALSETDRRRYFAETSVLASLMGAPVEQFPSSMKELDAYYSSVQENFRTKQGWWPDRLGALRILTEMGDGRSVRDVGIDLTLLLSELMCLAVLPRTFRRHNGLPAVLDPAVRLAYWATLPVFAALGASPAMTEAVHRAYCRDDEETTRLLMSALDQTTMRAQQALATDADGLPVRIGRDGAWRGEGEELERFFDSLDPVAATELSGRWRGREILSDHPLDGALGRIGWYGKQFDGPDDVKPILVATGSGDVYPLDPAKVPTGMFLSPPRLPRFVDQVMRRVMDVGRPVLGTEESTATLRTIRHHGVETAAMIYDKQPVVDVFRSLGPGRVLGLMDYRGMQRPYFFVLEREDLAD